MKLKFSTLPADEARLARGEKRREEKRVHIGATKAANCDGIEIYVPRQQ